jgi:hypothetical protein
MLQVRNRRYRLPFSQPLFRPSQRLHE